MPANLENSTVATGLEKVNFHSNLKEGQCQRMFKLLHSFHMLAMSFPSGSDGKVSGCNMGDLGLIPGLGRCAGEGNGDPL